MNLLLKRSLILKRLTSAVAAAPVERGTGLRAMPAIIEAAGDAQLKQAFQSRLEETELHCSRLREILGRSGPDGLSPLKCRTMAMLINEAEGEIGNARHVPVRGAALIAIAQRIVHYEIAFYGTLRHFARVLGLEQDAELLDQTADEEGHFDHILTDISERLDSLARYAA